jgi:hypothetical protein
MCFETEFASPLCLARILVFISTCVCVTGLPATGRPEALAREHKENLLYKINSVRIAPRQISGRLLPGLHPQSYHQTCQYHRIHCKMLVLIN